LVQLVEYISKTAVPGLMEAILHLLFASRIEFRDATGRDLGVALKPKIGPLYRTITI
jgi:hypothetical protein